MTTAASVSRRRFLGSSAATAGALVVGFHVPIPVLSAAAAQGVAARSTPGS